MSGGLFHLPATVRSGEADAGLTETGSRNPASNALKNFFVLPAPLRQMDKTLSRH